MYLLDKTYLQRKESRLKFNRNSDRFFRLNLKQNLIPSPTGNVISYDSNSDSYYPWASTSPGWFHLGFRRKKHYVKTSAKKWLSVEFQTELFRLEICFDLFLILKKTTCSKMDRPDSRINRNTRIVTFNESCAHHKCLREQNLKLEFMGYPDIETREFSFSEIVTFRRRILEHISN